MFRLFFSNSETDEGMTLEREAKTRKAASKIAHEIVASQTEPGWYVVKIERIK